jgi:mono/diheme cytochrome c family protein
MRRSLVLTLVGGVIVAAGAAAWLFWPRTVRIDATDRALVARGEPLYQAHCASCHGALLEGQPNWQSRNEQGRLPAPPHDDSGHTWHHDDEVLFEVTKYGITKHAPAGYQSDMPGFESKLSDADILATLAFIKSRWSTKVRERRVAAGMD